MKPRKTFWAWAILTVACAATPLLAADDPATRKDLFTVITLQGLPCGEVISVATRGDNDHIVSCKDGNRYRGEWLNEVACRNSGGKTFKFSRYAGRASFYSCPAGKK